jgi:nucleoside-diphosphate-sugar epimerase
MREAADDRPILVTGDTGIAGRHVADLLRAYGHRVISGSRRAERGGLILDITDRRSIDALPDFRGVVHCAGLTPRVRARWSDFELVNVKGSEQLATAAAARRASFFIYVSTGGRLGGRHATETTRLYVLSKYLGERRIRQRLRGAVVGLSLRASSLYGEYDRGSTSRLIRGVAAGRVVVPAHGSVRKCLLYAGSLARVIREIVSARDFVGWRAVPTSDLESYELNEIISAIEAATGRHAARVPVSPAILRSGARVVERLGEIARRPGLAELGYSARIALTSVPCPSDNLMRRYTHATVPLREGIRREVEWMRASGAL